MRGDQYKYTTYYGLWDTDELYDIRKDPGETTNLIADPKFRDIAKQFENQLYTMLEEQGGMAFPLSQPRGGSQNKRLAPRGGQQASDFPHHLVVPEPINRNAQ